MAPLPPAASRAVLSLDDDILMPCTDLERGFALWRASPRQLVGWYPRLLRPAGGKGAPGSPVYQFEPAVFKQVGQCRGGHTSRQGVHARSCCSVVRLAAVHTTSRAHLHHLCSIGLCCVCCGQRGMPSARRLPPLLAPAGPVQRNLGGCGLHGQRRPVPCLLVAPAGARPRSG